MTAGQSARRVASKSQGVAAWAAHRANAFERGSDGEREVAEAVAPLSARGWFILHDRLAPRGGNVDHLLVGPGGVVVLDAKAWSGTLSVSENGRLQRNGRDAHKAIDSMNAVLAHLRDAMPSVPVSGGLVFVGNDQAHVLQKRLDDVGLCDVADVVGVLERKPTVLTPRAVEAAVALVIDVLPAAGKVELVRPDPVDSRFLDLEAAQVIADEPAEKRYRFYVARTWSRFGKRRLYLNSPDGSPIGWLDTNDGTVRLDSGASPDAEPLLRRLADPTLVPEPDVAALTPKGRLGTRLLRSLGHDRRGVGHVVAHVWRKADKHRLYVTAHVAGSTGASVGWIDLNTGVEHLNDPALAGLLTHSWHVVYDAVITRD